MYDETPVSRAVREAVDSVAAPDVRVQILHRALHMSREHEIPGGGEPLQKFVEKHLKAATAFYLGEEAAESVMRSLGPIVSLAKKLGNEGAEQISGRNQTTKRFGGNTTRKRGSRSETRKLGGGNREDAQSAHEKRRSTPPHGDLADDAPPTDRYPTVAPRGSALPMVLVATASAERFREINSHLSYVAAVQQVEDVVSFLDNLKATASLSPLVVIDCVETSIQPSTLATLAHELPANSTVLLWGATEQAHKDLQSLVKRDQGWVRCGAEASPSDVASLVQVLLGE